MASRSGSKIKIPAVVGAIVDLGTCLNLIDPVNVGTVKRAHELYLFQCKALGAEPLQNKGRESKLRFLDCAVMGMLHKLREEQQEPAFDSVRGFFVEGEPIYPTAGLRSLDHIQVCVRNPKCIRGFFRPSLDVL